MDVADLYVEATGRVTEQVPAVLAGLDVDDLAWRPEPGANSIAWLLWHLTRVADEYTALYAGTEERWTAAGWHARFGLPFPAEANGYQHTPEEVARVRVSGELLAGYYADVEPVLIAFLRTLDPDSLERIVDTSYDPPVSLGVRMVSIVDDMVQHMAQAAYLRGILDRR
jgi:uncharacterized damage-inducible protein DinB